MNEMDLSAIALGGLEQAQAQFEQAAGQIAAPAAAPDGPPIDTVDLSEAIVSLLAAKSQFDANIAVLKTANEMQRHIVDFLA